MGKNNDEEAIRRMREVEKAAQEREAAARSKELTREALRIQRQAKRGAGNGHKRKGK